MAWKTLRNFSLNTVGNFAPVVVAVAAFPVIAHLAGTERLGFLGLAWTLIGYLGLLDLGLARVVLRRVAQATTPERRAVERSVVTRICAVLFAVSLPVVILVGLFAPVQWLLGRDAAPALIDEAALALRIVLAALPLVIVTGVLRGVLDGRLWFGTSNLLKIVFGALTYLAPMLAAFWQPTLPVLVGAIALGRLLALIAHAGAASAALPDTGKRVVTRMQLMPLLAEGGWYTVTSIVGPLMVSFDRFAVASLVSLAAAAYYIVPQDVVLRLLLLPAALAGTVFPMMAHAHGTGNEARQHDLGQRSFMAALALGLPLCVLLALTAEPALRIWMGADFARESAGVAAIFAIGLLANCAAQVPYAAIQAAGRADLTGKLHLAELPFYAAWLLPLVWQWGLTGAAIAWTLRTMADCLALLWIAGRHGFMRGVGREAATLLWTSLLVAAAAALPDAATGGARVALGLGLLAIAGTWAWRWVRALGVFKD